jgi:inhibitor of cysteine peptidase
MQYQYDESANGRQVETKLNEDLKISLPEARTAGYQWAVTNAGAPVCRLLDESAQPNSSSTGGSGHHVWRFQTVAAGTGAIELQYRRPWENSVEPARTFALNVRVAA